MKRKILRAIEWIANAITELILDIIGVGIAVFIIFAAIGKDFDLIDAPKYTCLFYGVLLLIKHGKWILHR